MKQFTCLLFIDDNYATNYYHREIAEEAGIAKNVIFFQRAHEALQYLEEIDKNNLEMPELIFLDINMPEMNSWEFIEQYAHGIKNQSSQIVILSTSINPMDKAVATQNPHVSDFLTKPLSLEFFQELSTRYLSKV